MSTFAWVLCLILASVQCYLATAGNSGDRIEIWNVFTNSSVPATLRRRHGPMEHVRGASDGAPQQRPNDYVIGYNGAGNVLAKSELVQTELSSFELRVYTESAIRFIEARDQSENGTGGFVRRVSGGIDEQYLYMVFGSTGGHPIDFTVNVWTTDVNDFGTPASEFELGNMTDKSLIIFGGMLKIPSFDDTEQLQLSFDINSMPDFYFTRIEAFDMSDTQTTGGNVLITRGGIGYNSVGVQVTAAEPGRDVHMYLVMFAENLLTGGNNFWLGSFEPNLDILSIGVLTAEPVNGVRINGRYSWSSEWFEIRFVQGWDHVERGTGHLENVSGGIGEQSIAVDVASGVGEPLDLDVVIMGKVFRSP